MTLSAAAAQLLDGGYTAHSALKILILVNSVSTCNIDANSQLTHDLYRANLIIRNEILMTRRHNFGAVDRLLCGLSLLALPFGVVVIFNVGDFRQMLPVVRAVH